MKDIKFKEKIIKKSILDNVLNDTAQYNLGETQTNAHVFDQVLQLHNVEIKSP